ncbi:hypothetical protein GGS23DRAFT_205824 [Durotheca rogersii]|uniref:uncharacterized protein n=1 Tax=Durotheca rogersii TaxID=419775 RepID=UPI00222045EE|nr:uncharacterized protein GGS23DRAFT_205824 [Durotheca rogersii]KAI5861038.1 hypothetical protein GGS23DRAFT_205824 [Durotheca rogersii]
MAEQIIQRACKRFRDEISIEDAQSIERTVRLDDVKTAIQDVEHELAAKQRLRNLQRLTPFVDAIYRYSQAVEVACNGTPYLPWIWAPVKLIIQGVHEYTHALDKVLMAYGNIGAHMPRFSRYAGAFPEHRDFQQLVAFLFEDIIEFHRRAYSMIRKPEWKMCFSSLWGRFDARFGSLLESIKHNSDLIDREAVSLNIMQMAESRQRSLKESECREKQWQAEQYRGLLNWLEAGDNVQELKLDWLASRCCTDTSGWIDKSSRLRSWLQRGRGNAVLWLQGKPGSGKSVLSARVINYLRSNRHHRVAFFFCDFYTPSSNVTTHIFRTICSQIVEMDDDFVPFLYSEYISKGQKPTISVLKELLPRLLQRFDDVRLVVDGIDEIPSSEHRSLIKDLIQLTKSAQGCKILLISQEVPSIASSLSKQPKLCITDEKALVQQDIAMMVDGSLEDLNGTHGGIIEKAELRKLKRDIMEKAEGMFLWVRLILDLLYMATSTQDLHFRVDSLPKDLAEAYSKILSNMCSRCLPEDVSKIGRVFSWLLYQKGRHALRKHQIRLSMALHFGCDVLDKDTKPFPDATDICKPLIEDGLEDSLTFVHSTVPKFLLEHGNNNLPFINPTESQHSIAYACVSQLKQGLDLLTGPEQDPISLPKVASGIHGLLPYATENWVHHVLEYVGMLGNPISDGRDPLIRQLNALCQRIAALEHQPYYHGIDEVKKLEPRLRLLDSVREVQGFIAYFIQLREDEKTSTVINNTADIFRRSTENYHRLGQHLLKQRSLLSVPQQDLVNFQAEYAPTAFVCQKSGCDRAYVGFSTQRLLRDHEIRHTTGLRCYEVECSYNDVGFPTEKSLRNHMRKRHPHAKPTAVPVRLRNSQPIRQVSPETESRTLQEYRRKMHDFDQLSIQRHMSMKQA